MSLLSLATGLLIYCLVVYFCYFCQRVAAVCRANVTDVGDVASAAAMAFDRIKM